MKFRGAGSIAVLFLTLVSCSSHPPPPIAPLWAKQPTRTVDNGYIVYVESDDDPNHDRARFKSESAALADLANECTLIPKGVRIEDRYESKTGMMYQIYSKVGVEFQACEEAKKAVTPEAIRKLANVAMTEQVKKYQDMIGQTPETLAQETGETPSAEETGTTVAAGGPLQAPAPIAVANETHFYVIREQIVWEKRDVILAPPTAYQPQSPESQRFAAHITQQTQAAQTYEQAHPETKTTVHAWSKYRHELMRPRPPTGGRAVVAPRAAKPVAPTVPQARKGRRRREPRN